MIEIGIMEFRLNVPFDVLVANVASTTVHVPEHIVLCVSSNGMVSIIDLEQVHEEHRHTVTTVQADAIPRVQEMNAKHYQTATKNGRIL